MNSCVKGAVWCMGVLGMAASGSVACADPLPAPLVHWTFDGGAATNCGSGGAAYDAIVSGAVAYTNGLAEGGLCLLGGSQGYAALPYTLGDQGTIAFWYKPFRFYNWNSLFDNTRDANQWEMWLDEGANVRFRLAGGQGDIAYGNLNSLHNGSNVWYHFTVTWDRYAETNHARLYVNGCERTRANISSWVEPGSTVYFGGHTGNSPAEGILDDVRVYGTALADTQVQALHALIAEQAPAVQVSFDASVTNTGTGGAKFDAALAGEPAWTNGLNGLGQALALDGVDDYASIPYRLPVSGSVSLWYYAPGPWYDFNTVYDNSVNGNHYECWIAGDSWLACRPAGNQWPQRAAYKLDSGSNRWYHIVGTWDTLSSNMVLFVNGVERGRAVNTNGWAWPIAGTHFFIGGGHPDNAPGRGAASDLQIFETPLSSNRVAAIFNERRARNRGLAAYVPFDGTAVDIAGSNAVVLGGSPVYVKTQGGFYKGLSCGNPVTNEADNASISNALGSSVGTIALWYYARPWYNYQTVFDNQVFEEYWECWIYNDGRLASRVSNKSGGGDVRYDLDNLRGPDSWYHIAFVWDLGLGQTRLYVDGVLRSTAALTAGGWVDPDPTLNLAGGNAGNSKGNGIWDEVRVYDRALTDEEIAALTVIPPLPPPRGTLFTLY
ncbi:MAG: LamG domain-containing protein [Kiritimatiellae bacterium]|nr:LamG domain-containing protein [Kiritimatiellia bacterium]